MTPRIDIPPPDAMSAAQYQVYQDLVSGPRGGIAGPFGPWLLSPALADRAQKLGEFVRFNTTLPARLSELAILFTAMHWRAQFEWHVHAPIAERAGLDPAAIAALGQGRRPSFTQADEAAIYDFCDELYRTRRVAEAVYGRAKTHLGDKGMVELVGILGYYALVSMTLNVFAIPAPAPLPFPED